MNTTCLNDSVANYTPLHAPHPRETTPASSGSKIKFTRRHTAAQLHTTTTTAGTAFAALVTHNKHTH